MLCELVIRDIFELQDLHGADVTCMQPGHDVPKIVLTIFVKLKFVKVRFARAGFVISLNRE